MDRAGQADPGVGAAAGVGPRPSNLRWARAALVIGGLLLAAGAGLIVWDAASDDSPAPVVITGTGG